MQRRAATDVQARQQALDEAQPALRLKVLQHDIGVDEGEAAGRGKLAQLLHQRHVAAAGSGQVARRLRAHRLRHVHADAPL